MGDKAKPRSISMTDGDYEKIQMLAEMHGQTITAYMMAALKMHASMDNVNLDGSPPNGGMRLEAVAYQRGAAWTRNAIEQGWDVDVFSHVFTPDTSEGYQEWIVAEGHKSSDSLEKSFLRGASDVWEKKRRNA